MKPYYEDELVTLYHGDCREVLTGLDAGAVDAVITDPPYGINKASWDKFDDYAGWSQDWIRDASRVLSAEGAFWCFHSMPDVLAMLARCIEEHGRPLVSFITLDKSSHSIANRYASAGTKTFPASAEYATYSRREVYAGQIRAAREARGLSRGEFDTLISPSRKPTGLCYRWEKGERIPQPPEVESIEREFGVQLLVPTFHNPQKHPVVWDFPFVDTTDHPTAKPLSVMARMVRTTTNPGDLIVDPFAGSGTTLRAAVDLGRRAVGIEADERYCEVIAKRLAQGAFDFGGVA